MLAPLLYYLFIYPISKLPFRALYFLSDIFFVIVFYIVPYRKKVVFENLRRSFPLKNESEIKAIAKSYYAHFCDITLESFKMFSITKEELRERFQVPDTTLLHKLYNQGTHFLCAGGHYNNWEFFAVAGKLYVPHECHAIYRPLQNEWFDNTMKKSRTQLGLYMWPIKKTKEMFEAKKPTPAGYFFAMDQSPSKAKKCHWMMFLNQETGVSYGAEKYARENNLPILYYRIHKVKRGYYTAEFEMVTENPGSFPTGAIVETLMRKLEVDINKQPDYWLWSHRRWKRKKPDDIVISSAT